MLYQPKYCCNCGEKIERISWKLWTSRRFCDVCESEQKHYDLIPRAVVAAGLLVGLFGISGFVRNSGDADKPKQAAFAASVRAVPSTAVNAPARGDAMANSKAGPAPSPVTAAAPEVRSPTGNNKVLAPAEKAFFCGAMTRKGTPCSRRVKTPGRCWQHASQSAAGK